MDGWIHPSSPPAIQRCQSHPGPLSFARGRCDALRCAAAGMRAGVSLMHAAPPEVMVAQLGNQESSTLRGI